MRRSSLFFLFTKALVIPAVALTLTAGAWAAPKYKVLYSFGSGDDASGPYAPVVMDVSGNLYGTAGGGTYHLGTVFQLTPGSHGWTESVLYSFGGTKDDGVGPQAGVTLDKLGNLYGTTQWGGVYDRGTVFELTPGSSGWTESVLYSFGANNGDGIVPYAGVVLDAAGDLYGTTVGGGASEGGTVYELSPGSGGWNETLLYGFGGKNNDGYCPYAGLIWDNAGDLYGTTEMGGTHGDGAVYELRHTPGGAWKEHILYNFGSAKGDGAFPWTGSLVFDTSGNLYGVTPVGGTNICFSEYDCGTVYELSPGRNGRWKERVLYNFSQGAGGNGPVGVVMDQAGNLYGATFYGGSACGCGVVFKLSPRAHGQWKYTVLHRFSGTDGGAPEAGVILDGKGNLYGTTLGGGQYGGGVVFELTP
jgi:uncharacterized repeat protein (TIGR03803 family)